MVKYLSRWRAELMGIAALLIVLYHARADVPLKLWTHVVTNNGNMGVDIFLFLSGFGCICSLKRNPELRQYYARRMKRLLPAYYVGIALQILVVGVPSAQLLAACLLPIGVWTGQTTGYWYISACVLFYLLIPLMLSALDRVKYPRVCLTAMMLFAAVVLPIATRDGPPSRAVMRLPALIAGTGAGFLCQAGNDARPRWKDAALLAAMYAAGLVLMLHPGFLSGLIDRIYRPQQLEYAAKALRAPLLTLLAALALEGLSRTPLRGVHRVLRYLGGISLEIYVGHEVVKAMAVEWLGLSGLRLMAVLALLCVPSALLVKLLARLLAKGVKLGITAVMAAMLVAIFVLPTPTAERYTTGVQMVADKPEVEVYGPALPNLIVQGYTRENTGSIIVGEVANDVHYVYAADGADCYHEYECKFAFASSQRLTVYEAYHLGFRPCGRCNPPVYVPGETDPITAQPLTATSQTVTEEVAPEETAG